MYFALQTHTDLKAHTIHWKLLHAPCFSHIVQPVFIQMLIPQIFN